MTQRAAPHGAVACLAILLAAVVQASWLALTAPATPPAWRLAVGVTVAAATLWLISLAACHTRLARRLANSSLARGFMLAESAGDCVVAAAAALILWQGFASPLSLAGLWLIPPVLLTAAVPSAPLLMAAAWQAAGLHPASATATSRLNATLAFCHLLSIVLLLAALAFLASRSQPFTGH